MDTGVSDHYVVYVIWKELGTQYNGHRMRKVRIFTSGYEDQLLTDLRQVQWEDIMNSGGTFQFRPEDEEGIAHVLGNLNVSKATGVDGISAGMLKLTAPAISSSMCGIFNETLMMAEIPVQWKAARIVPIPKSTHAKCVEDFRPVSVLL